MSERFPLTAYPFHTMLDPVEVPRGQYPIEVVQFWRGGFAPHDPLPLHWAIVVRTATNHGNRVEIVSYSNTYITQVRFDVPLIETDDWRGGHVVGHVAPYMMETLLDHVALVPVVRDRWRWNYQSWAFEVLQRLDENGLYADGDMTFEELQTQMQCLLEAWEAGGHLRATGR